ncbi:MAG: 50S ribosomal protein L10 [Planctomycetota bacterium]|jgi:large subunit ribosomal protein L10
MSKELKHMMAEAVKVDLDRSPNVLVLGLLPLNAENTHNLRKSLRENGGSMRVIHNRTTKHALDDDRKGLGDFFTGQTAIAIGESEETDFIGLAKLFVDAQKKKHVECRGGYVDGELFDKAGFEALAQSPDKPTLRAMLCGAILGPGRGLATIMNAVGGGMARCIQQRVDEGGGAEEPAPEPAPANEETAADDAAAE